MNSKRLIEAYKKVLTPLIFTLEMNKKNRQPSKKN